MNTTNMFTPNTVRVTYETNLTNRTKKQDEVAVFDAYTNFVEEGVRTTNKRLIRNRAK